MSTESKAYTAMQKKKCCQICLCSFVNLKSLELHMKSNNCKMGEDALGAKPKTSLSITGLQDYFNDPERDEPLIGLQYAVQFIKPGSLRQVYKCIICDVASDLISIIQHFTGAKHRRTYMEQKYPQMLLSLQACGNKSDRTLCLKEKARDLERMEGIKELNITCMTTSSFPRCDDGADSAKKKKEFNVKEYPVDKKQATLKYLETFTINSHAEASAFLSLTQTLSEAFTGFCEKSKKKDVPELSPKKVPLTSSKEQMPVTPYEQKTEFWYKDEDYRQSSGFETQQRKSPCEDKQLYQGPATSSLHTTKEPAPCNSSNGNSGSGYERKVKKTRWSNVEPSPAPSTSRFSQEAPITEKASGASEEMASKYMFSQSKVDQSADSSRPGNQSQFGNVSSSFRPSGETLTYPFSGPYSSGQAPSTSRFSQEAPITEKARGASEEMASKYMFSQSKVDQSADSSRPGNQSQFGNVSSSFRPSGETLTYPFSGPYSSDHRSSSSWAAGAQVHSQDRTSHRDWNEGQDALYTSSSNVPNSTRKPDAAPNSAFYNQEPTSSNVITRPFHNPPPSTTYSSYEQASQESLSSNTGGSVSKTLTSDMLQLLKGKDVATVFKLLQSLSPYYPSLQGMYLVNL
ncbi:hypothetical protein FKM82_029829 [Ascaphus truei]